MRYDIPYGDKKVYFEAPEGSVIFEGEMTSIPGIKDLRGALISALGSPISASALKDLARGKKNIVFLVEDNTRSTPLHIIMPIITDYLNENGVPDSAMSFLTAPGTHRLMTDEEILEKLGPEMIRRFRVVQHDANVREDMKDLGTVLAGDYKIPVHVNKYALDADLLVGIGNIVPHCDAGYSGGAKILQPGVCDFVTTSATHAAAGFCADIPLGMADGNPCRMGMEEVARIAGLAFIVNTVKNYEGEVAGIFAGDFIKAHREGIKLAERSYSIRVPEPADIVIVSSSPSDMDYWQGCKGTTCAYFAVKKGGIIIFAAPCTEGLAHNHPRFRDWLSLPMDETLRMLRAASPEDVEADLVSAVLSVCNCRARDKAKIFCVSDGLTEEDLTAMQYKPFPTVQNALDEAIRLIPGATIGIIPKGGISLPIIEK
ncbi:MAG: nickel-dependent lactate racemase [Synergistaceae bacterium]|nr:nickel-dependent lactate racemase [Synergistaceae bacterium]